MNLRRSVTALLVTLTAAVTTGCTADDTPPAAPAPAGPRAAASPDVDSSARTAIREILSTPRLADRHDEVTGPYDYTEYRQLGHDLSGAITSGSGGPEVTAIRYQQWRTHAGTGRVVDWDETRGCTTWTSDTRSNRDLNATLPHGQQPATDRSTLLDQLASIDPAIRTDPAALLSMISDLYRTTYIAPSVRTALIEILADTPHLTAQRGAADRTGRPALAVTARTTRAETGYRITIYLDPATGRALATEQTPLAPLTTSDTMAAAAIDGYVLYLANTRTPTTTTPTAACR
ncbi:hypothetical protein F4553_000096 [Allocatelliglobosispora scoriae]|uniref:Lipoprotein n=1 Tax=Allocatelliglobosispora scoriae TaxID=643052 RepID=A0A841BC85_9ACTN|nr:hypothetical protein [Allocatelliglobosispora scoriae]MBB5866717.1 hypothetical protein [Allocatelliglobosispora scoriae]